MDRKEMMDGGCKKLPESFSSNKNVATSSPRKWEEGRNSELFGSLSQGQNHEVHRELTSSEFLEFLRKQGPEEEQFRSAWRSNMTDGKFRGKSMYSKDMMRKQESESAAIDQCNITSSVDYGSRDYYHISKQTSVDDAPYVAKENGLDDADTRGNWWQGSLYY